MAEPLRWITEGYRGMYVHVMAFEMADIAVARDTPGPKWGYLLGVGRSKAPTTDMQYGLDVDEQDYFTRAAAEQGALHFGKRLIDVILECQ
ncbi:hypothetical protein [Cupriavidus consociatus]|uniref:hypothetical protein n=1 Tax=Cupriavidus consociatus TaxID=2821357 RepID=UPI001AE75D89|nr:MULTISPECIES: hypothetical protein [unclassified Cupriavidus]MBP0619158.1 hypothetical protein [Cupriavidus sp. LEh25]MDK2655804.1 hypothetical protein [Cupriavidus sp. LEh21]